MRPLTRKYREYLKSQGLWEQYVYPVPVIEHLNNLSATGASWRAISMAAGLGVGTAWDIAQGNYSQVRSDVARKIQAVRPEDIAPYYVPANGSRWRLRSLVAMGHSRERMARALGVHRQTITNWLDPQRAEIRAADAVEVRQLWAAWGNKRPPERDQYERRSASRARGQAQGADWCTPANLDEDELDTPGYRPRSHWQPALGVSVADDYPLGLPERVRASEAQPEREAG